ncbi:hypothetical protein [Niastella populi]|uniref:Uncharacterized protein n=1 Tax=Niastella populi TaxID=550983 RepID=A0A1V9F0J6_9BACT|nr:hypothetical protein [Niastella populi]OQP51901.1 hypothetical protein A4R26_29220 [Niastella populi]
MGFSSFAQVKSLKVQVTTAPKQRLDSIIQTETLFYKELGQESVVNHIDKTFYLYDSLNAPIESILYDNGYEKVEEWRGTKYLKEHDALGRDTVIYEYEFRNKMFDWRLKGKTVYSYLKNTGKYAAYTSYSRNNSWEEEKTNEWNERSMVEFKYDQHDSLIEKTSYSWSYGSQEKRPNNRDVYQYDHKNKVLHSVFYFWDRVAKDWQPNFKKDIYFNQKWHEINGIQHTWDAKSKTWEKNQKHEYLYNTSGKRTEEKYYFFDSKTAAYFTTGNNSYVYDKAGNVTAEISTNYSWTTKELTSKSKHECVYDSLHNMITSNYYNWNLSKNVWELSSESHSAYDPTMRGNLVIMPFHSNYKLLSSHSVSYSNGVKKSASEYKYYYSNL